MSILEMETREHAAGAKRSVAWYRTPIDRKVMQKLQERSDALGLAQSLGHLAVILTTGTLAAWSALHWAWWITVPLVYLHGTCYAFMINAVHEIGHGTVFKSRRLTNIFVHLFAFLGWINHEMFEASHARHHRYTLHPPDDLEVVLPVRFNLRAWVQIALVNVEGIYHTLKNTLRIARGRFAGEWELRCFPPDEPERRVAPVRWARVLLIGHGLILAGALAMGWWLVPLLFTFAVFYGGLVQFLMNAAQHTGLQDNVDDFRLCCRTIIVNPVFQFLYWHMNYHTEHHMFAAVPCYNLGKLHRAMRHDMPPCPVGLRATWREIMMILDRQAKDPKYQHVAPLPGKASTSAASAGADAAQPIPQAG